MILTIITLVTALAIAGVAAWFSIVGLMAIFAAAPISILIMGTVLEVGKLASASWLYRNWSDAPFLLKSYLTVAVVVLMFITSMGIFGFLSKAHIEQSASVGDNNAKIARLEQRISYERRQTVDFEKIIEQLDMAVNTLVKYDKISGETGAIAVRRQQKAERDELSVNIAAVQVKIDEFEDEKAVLSSEVRQFELEVGPLKYIADMIYEDSAAKLESAVRLVTLIIIFVFDPLAVLLLIAANHSMREILADKKDRKKPPEEVNTISDGVAHEIEIEETPQRETEVTAQEDADGWGVSVSFEGAEVSGTSGDGVLQQETAGATSGTAEEVEKQDTEDEEASDIVEQTAPKDEDGITDNIDQEPIAAVRNWVNTGRRYNEQKD